MAKKSLDLYNLKDRLSLDRRHFTMVSGVGATAPFLVTMVSHHWYRKPDLEAGGFWDGGLWEKCHTLPFGTKLCSHRDMSKGHQEWLLTRTLLTVALVFIVVGIFSNLKELFDEKTGKQFRMPTLICFIGAGVTSLAGIWAFCAVDDLRTHPSWCVFVQPFVAVWLLLTGLLPLVCHAVKRTQRRRQVFRTRIKTRSVRVGSQDLVFSVRAYHLDSHPSTLV